MPSGIYGSIVGRLRDDEPAVGGLKSAAVAVILRDPESPSVLLIKRAERAGDPWSGQVAFPGGKSQQGDGTAEGTAARETLEEVGVDLGKKAEFLGYGDPLRTHTGTMEVVPAVFLLRGEAKMTPNEEVASYNWVSLDELLSPHSKSTFVLSYGGQTTRMPAFSAGDYLVWGLTHRMIVALVGES